MFGGGKKLLVLDVNGLLIDTYFEGQARPDRNHDAKVNKFSVYKRPFCDEFVQFCLDNFVVGVWSSALEHNVRALVDYVFREAKGKLAFIWHQKHCTHTGFKHPENKHKPLFLKELWRLWTNYDRTLPWAEGAFDPANSLLIDDSAYKAMNNPPHTAIFPKTYKATDLGDKYLDGELRTYLEGLLESANVQAYLQGHPIGEPSIVVGDPQFTEILSAVRFKNEMECFVPRHLTGMIALGHDLFHSSDHWRKDRIVPVGTGRTQLGAPDGPWDVAELARADQEIPVSRIVSREWAGAYPSSDVAPPLLPQPRIIGNGLPGILPTPGQIPDWRPPVGEHQELGPRVPPHREFRRAEWGRGIPESDIRARSRPGLGPHGNGYDPLGHVDWRKNQQRHRSAEEMGPTVEDISEFPHVGRRHDGVDAHAIEYRSGRGYPEADMSGRFAAFQRGGELFGAGSAWRQQPEPFEETQDFLMSKLPSDQQKRRAEDRLQHFEAESVKASNGGLILGTYGAPRMGSSGQDRFGTVHGRDWEHSNPARRSGDHSDLGRNETFSGSSAGTHGPFQGRYDKTHPLETVNLRSMPSNWPFSSINRPSLSDRMLDGSVSGQRQADDGALIVRDGEMCRVGAEDRLRTFPEEVMNSKSGYDRDLSPQLRGSPSRWSPSPSRYSPSRMRNSYAKSDPRSPRASQYKAFDTGKLDVFNDLSRTHPAWGAGEARPFPSSIDQHVQRLAADAAPAEGGRFVSANYGNPRARRDIRGQEVAHDTAWEHPDHVRKADAFEKVRDYQSGRSLSISDIDDRPSSPTRARSYDGFSGPGNLRTKKISDPSLERQIGIGNGHYEPASRSRDRSYADYNKGELSYRSRDSDMMGRGLPLEEKAFFEGQFRGFNRGGNKESNWRADSWLGPRESMTVIRGVSAKMNRFSAGEAEDRDEHRESFVNDSKRHVIRDRDRFRAREYEEPDGPPSMSKRLGDGHERAKEGRDWHRLAGREYRGDGGRHGHSRRLNWSRKRDHERDQVYGGQYEREEDANWHRDDRISKRRPGR